jgi:sensor histidine kinase YesM
MVFPIAVIINFFIFGSSYFQSFYGFFWPSLISTCVVAGIYLVCSAIAGMLLGHFPTYRQTLRRIAFEMLLFVLVTFTAISLLFYGYEYLALNGLNVQMENYWWVIFVGIVFNLLATSFNEGVAFYEKWKQVVDETENLKKEHLQSQLEGLKGQVNPHFLFNSLNSLSSLISDDPEKAEKFLDEMSKVYRYLLRTNEEGLTTLESEMHFIYSYFHLLKTRYGEGLELETRIDDFYLDYQLPPLTLQMLVENAVKHNMLLKNSPLVILIMTTNSGKLIVSNNLQRKERMVSSNKVGLTNIVKKYRLMKQEEITIRDDGKEFAVIIPLITPKH